VDIASTFTPRETKETIVVPPEGPKLEGVELPRRKGWEEIRAAQLEAVGETLSGPRGASR